LSSGLSHFAVAVAGLTLVYPIAVGCFGHAATAMPCDRPLASRYRHDLHDYKYTRCNGQEGKGVNCWPTDASGGDGEGRPPFEQS
jgi:hypothetical protein